jgi:hypothetical protein
MQCEMNGVGALSMGVQGPYELYDADLWKCPACGREAIHGFGAKPVASAFEPDFAARVAAYLRVVEFWMNPRERRDWLAAKGPQPEV